MEIGHIAIFVKDLETVKCFFERFFRGKSNNQYHNSHTGLRTYFLSFEGKCSLELMYRPDVIEAIVPINHLGYAHIAFSVGDKNEVEKLTKELSDEGYKVLSGPRVTGDGFYESCILGPENIMIEITI